MTIFMAAIGQSKMAAAFTLEDQNGKTPGVRKNLAICD